MPHDSMLTVIGWGNKAGLNSRFRINKKKEKRTKQSLRFTSCRSSSSRTYFICFSFFHTICYMLQVYKFKRGERREKQSYEFFVHGRLVMDSTSKSREVPFFAATKGKSGNIVINSITYFPPNNKLYYIHKHVLARRTAY